MIVMRWEISLMVALRSGGGCFGFRSSSAMLRIFLSDGEQEIDGCQGGRARLYFIGRRLSIEYTYHLPLEGVWQYCCLCIPPIHRHVHAAHKT